MLEKMCCNDIEDIYSLIAEILYVFDNPSFVYELYISEYLDENIKDDEVINT